MEMRMTRKRTVTREKVVAEAIAQADAHGFEAVTLSGVARALEVQVPSLYNHVAGLAGLHEQMALWGLGQLGDCVQDAAIGKSGDAAVRSMAHAYRRFAHQHPGVYGVTLTPPPPEQARVREAGERLVEIAVAVFRAYGHDPDTTLHLVRAFRSVVHGFVDLELRGGFGMALDRDASFNRMLDIFVAGLS
jgi:AcrR family transcriptional regulator